MRCKLKGELQLNEFTNWIFTLLIIFLSCWAESVYIYILCTCDSSRCFCFTKLIACSFNVVSYLLHRISLCFIELCDGNLNSGHIFSFCRIFFVFFFALKWHKPWHADTTILPANFFPCRIFCTLFRCRWRFFCCCCCSLRCFFRLFQKFYFRRK